MDFERSKRRVLDLNLTALIDIVFHLMVFVMLTTTFVVSESMELSLPSGKSQAASSAQIMRIILSPDGTLHVNNQPVTADGLNKVLVSQLGDAPDTKIAIFTTPAVTVQQLVSVMDMVYLAGGHNVQVDKAG